MWVCQWKIKLRFDPCLSAQYGQKAFSNLYCLNFLSYDQQFESIYFFTWGNQEVTAALFFHHYRYLLRCFYLWRQHIEKIHVNGLVKKIISVQCIFCINFKVLCSSSSFLQIIHFAILLLIFTSWQPDFSHSLAYAPTLLMLQSKTWLYQTFVRGVIDSFVTCQAALTLGTIPHHFYIMSHGYLCFSFLNDTDHNIWARNAC